MSERTPERIKRDLFICADREGNCPYCSHAVDGVMDREGQCFKDLVWEALQLIERLMRERDQAVADLHALALQKGSCHACIHRPKEGKCEYSGRCTAVISDSDFWEWRGVPKED